MKTTSKKIINELNLIYEKNQTEISEYILKDKNLIFINNDISKSVSTSLIDPEIK